MYIQYMYTVYSEVIMKMCNVECKYLYYLTSSQSSDIIGSSFFGKRASNSDNLSFDTKLFGGKTTCV